MLDRVLAGAAGEQALTAWARASRFAGSGDRAAVRDHVYDALRCRRSYAALGGAETGRGLMLGALRAAGRDQAALFTGQRYAPAPLTEAERVPPPRLEDLPEAVRLDCPDWLVPALTASLGADFAPVMAHLRARAPVFLRVNTPRADRAGAIAALAAEGIAARPHPLAGTALEVTENARKINASQAYRDGLVELQDAASQAVVEALGPLAGLRVLDYCAGGGGKALAMAAHHGAEVAAHDIDPGRMRDLPARAARAGASIRRLTTSDIAREAPFDLVLADAPCSGSGAWRRAPQGKWDLTAERLGELVAIQAEILDTAAGLAGPGGRIAYATCSLLDAENRNQISAFLDRSPHWRVEAEHRFTPLDGGDGFYMSVLTQRRSGD